MTPRVPVDGKALDWPRKVANAINGLLNAVGGLSDTAVTKSGTDAYTTTTISDPPTQAEVQAIADALATLSTQLK